MTDENQEGGGNPEEMADFDWQLEMIWEVLGGTIPQRDLTNVRVARMLDLRSASGVTLRRNGKAALKPSEASAIIKGYGLNTHFLDASLFDLRDPVEFRAELRKHGIGIYAGTPARRLMQKLDRALVQDGFTMVLRRAAGRRGLGYDGHQNKPVLRLHPGERVDLLITAEPGRFVAVIQLAQGSVDLIETLAPTTTHPDTMVEGRKGEKGQLILPRDRSDSFTIQRDPGLFRLVAVEGEEELVNLFSCGGLEKLGREGPVSMVEDDAPLDTAPPRLRDQDISAIIQWIETNPKARLRCAEVEFLVTES